MPPSEPEIREEDVRNPGVNYEPREADLRVVLAFLAALGLASVMVLLVLWGMFSYFRAKSAERGPLPSPRMYTSPPGVPQPRLQPNPVADYNVYRLSAGETLNSYGWVDQKAGIARIPIEQSDGPGGRARTAVEEDLGRGPRRRRRIRTRLRDRCPEHRVRKKTCAGRTGRKL